MIADAPDKPFGGVPLAEVRLNVDAVQLTEPGLVDRVLSAKRAFAIGLVATPDAAWTRLSIKKQSALLAAGGNESQAYLTDCKFEAAELDGASVARIISVDGRGASMKVPMFSRPNPGLGSAEPTKLPGVRAILYEVQPGKPAAAVRALASAFVPSTALTGFGDTSISGAGPSQLWLRMAETADGEHELGQLAISSGRENTASAPKQATATPVPATAAKTLRACPGSVSVRVLRAEGLRDAERIGKQDPYVRLSVCSEVPQGVDGAAEAGWPRVPCAERYNGTVKTHVAENQGTSPTWDEVVVVQADDLLTAGMLVEVFDEDTTSDDLIGACVLGLGQLCDQQSSTNAAEPDKAVTAGAAWYPVYYKGEHRGAIYLDIAVIAEQKQGTSQSGAVTGHRTATQGGVFLVRVLEAGKLRVVQSMGKQDPQAHVDLLPPPVELSKGEIKVLDGVTTSSAVATDAHTKAVWDSVLELPVTYDLSAASKAQITTPSLQLRVVDAGHVERLIGATRIAVEALLAEPGLVFDRTLGLQPTVGATSGSPGSAGQVHVRMVWWHPSAQSITKDMCIEALLRGSDGDKAAGGSQPTLPAESASEPKPLSLAIRWTRGRNLDPLQQGSHRKQVCTVDETCASVIADPFCHWQQQVLVHQSLPTLRVICIVQPHTAAVCLFAYSPPLCD